MRKFRLLVYCILFTIINLFIKFHPALKESSLLYPSPLTGNITDSKNHILIFSGRWRFLRIQIPYLYTNLRLNGGVIDVIDFMMVRYDKATRQNLVLFAEQTNGMFGLEIVRLHYLGYPPDQLPEDTFQAGLFPAVHYRLLELLKQRPNDRHFKLDDDIVYIHPGTFESMLRLRDPSVCNIHFGNIAGANWRCSCLHQEMGVYEDPLFNPDKLVFEFDPFAECGWNRLDCAEMGLRAFLHHYSLGSLDKMIFPGLYITGHAERFSINVFLFDRDMVHHKALMAAGPIANDDEGWWTVTYSRHVKTRNCIVGEGLVVHFSYSQNAASLEEKGLLAEFEKIAFNEVGDKLPTSIWELLGY